MIKVEVLFEHVATKALISRVYNYSLWKRLFALPDAIFFKVKQVIEKHIRVKKVYVCVSLYCNMQHATENDIFII
jgi:hypothetical protein